MSSVMNTSFCCAMSMTEWLFDFSEGSVQRSYAHFLVYDVVASTASIYTRCMQVAGVVVGKLGERFTVIHFRRFCPAEAGLNFAPHPDNERGLCIPPIEFFHSFLFKGRVGGYFQRMVGPSKISMPNSRFLSSPLPPRRIAVLFELKPKIFQKLTRCIEQGDEQRALVDQRERENLAEGGIQRLKGKSGVSHRGRFRDRRGIALAFAKEGGGCGSPGCEPGNGPPRQPKRRRPSESAPAIQADVANREEVKEPFKGLNWRFRQDRYPGEQCRDLS